MKTAKIFLFVLMVIVCSVCGYAGTNATLQFPGSYAASIGIYVKDLQTGEVIVDRNSEKALTPASVTKVLTASVALETLGKDFCFETSVSLVGKRNGDEWNGNIVVNAIGDPSIEHEAFELYKGFADSIVSHICSLNILKINGSIIISSNMPDVGLPGTWEVEDVPWAYGAGLFPLNWQGNYVKVFPKTGVSEPSAHLIVTAKRGRTTDLSRGVDSPYLTVYGTSANLRKKDWSVNTSNPDPAFTFKSILTAKLKDARITLTDKQSTNQTDTIEVYRHYSPPLSEICRVLLKDSDNLLAEGVLRTLAPDSTRSVCIESERAFLSEIGINADAAIIRDGSGLTRATRMQPKMIADLLEYMLVSDNGDTLLDCLPVAGFDGTMKNFLADSPLAGKLAFKTGSLSHVITYAGYKLDDNGDPTHIVVIMVNGFSCPSREVRKNIQDYILKLFDNQ